MTKKTPDKKTPELTYRSAPLERNDRGMPASLDEETRSVAVVAATENPVLVFDYERWEVINEVLLMSGCQLPQSRQIPLFDTHQRYDTSSVLGSARSLEITGGQLLCRSYFSTVPEAETPYTKVREGHLTDFSIGYRVLEATWIAEKETATIEGRVFEGPVRVATQWIPRELSVCPIGADDMAKVRAEADGDIEKNKNHKKEVTDMNPKFRALLETRGLSKDASDEEAWAFAEKNLIDPGQTANQRSAPPDTGKPASQQAADTADDKIRAAIVEERTRTAEINAMCRRFDCTDLVDPLVTEGKSVEEARKVVMDHIEKRKETDPGLSYRGPIEVVKDARDKFRAAGVDSLIIRSAHEALRQHCGAVFEKPAPGAEELRGYSLRELARESLRIAGISDKGNPLEMIGRALTTSDFPMILAAVANKSLFAGWETSGETWQVWCATGSVSDFKTNKSVRPSEFSDLDEVPEDTEYKYGKRIEAQEEYKIATYGKLFAISRQTIINDDLNALTNIPAGHGEAAARKVGDLPYAVLVANANMGDGVALFNDTNHKNVATGAFLTGPDVTTVAEGIRAMGVQKDLQGLRRLNIRPLFFLGTKALEGSAEVFFKTEKFSSNEASTRVNPYSGTYFTRVYEARLDDDDPLSWYLAGPKGKTVVVYFLNGVQTPYMETKQGWSVDGVEYKVRIDCGAKAMDWKGLYQNNGHA